MVCIYGDLEESPLIWGPWWFGACIGSRGGIRGRQAAWSGHNSPATPAHEEPEVTNWTSADLENNWLHTVQSDTPVLLVCVWSVYKEQTRDWSGAYIANYSHWHSSAWEVIFLTSVLESDPETAESVRVQFPTCQSLWQVQTENAKPAFMAGTWGRLLQFSWIFSLILAKGS